MGSFLRITLISLFAASGASAAICVALFALPARHKPDTTAVGAASRNETAKDTSSEAPNEIRYPDAVLPAPASPPNLFALHSPVGDSSSQIWATAHSSPAAKTSTPPASIQSVATQAAHAAIASSRPFATKAAAPSHVSSVAPHPKLANMLRPPRQPDVILTSATEPANPAEPAATARLTAPNEPPRLLRAPVAARPIAPVVKSPATFVVAAQASELPPATTAPTKSNPPEPIPPPVQGTPCAE